MLRCAPEHDADRGEADESSGFASVTLEVLGETTAVANPGEGSFDDPAFGQDNKAMEIAALDDLQPPCTSFGNRLGHFRPLVATVSVDALDEWEAMAGLPGYGNGTVSVLNIGGMNNDAQQEAEGVDQNMAFASCDLLARVVTRGVERRPL